MADKKKDYVDLGIVEIVILVSAFLGLMYWVFWPIWTFMGEVVKTLGGR